MTSKSSTPLRLAKLTLTGSGLILLSYALTFLPFPEPDRQLGIVSLLWQSRFEILCTAVPFLAGVWMAWHFKKCLLTGFRQDLWPEQQIETVRRWLEAFVFNWLLGALLLVFGLLVIGRFIRNEHVGFFYVLIFALNPLTSMRQALRKPDLPHALIWQDMQPIHSDHWGQSAFPPIER